MTKIDLDLRILCYIIEADDESAWYNKLTPEEQDDYIAKHSDSKAAHLFRLFREKRRLEGKPLKARIQESLRQETPPVVRSRSPAPRMGRGSVPSIPKNGPWGKRTIK